jgi:N-acyl homoserine lactone hydrolase
MGLKRASVEQDTAKQQGGASAPTYRIYPMVTAQALLSKMLFLYLIPNPGDIRAPALFWYIQGAGKHIIVDSAGAAMDLLENSRSGGWEDVKSFEMCLAKVGITPDDVDIVIQTHLHHDHVRNTRKCRNAKIYVQKAELEQARNPHPINGNMYGWFPKYGHELDYTVIEGDYELFPGIDLLFVPGHSAGCQAVAVNTDRGKAIITGFCTIYENFDPPASFNAPSSVICPGIHLDARQAYESLLRVKEEADLILPVHEPLCATEEYI